MIDWDIETVLGFDVVDLLLDIFWRWRAVFIRASRVGIAVVRFVSMSFPGAAGI
jgi:hypothetical protein